MSASAKAGLKSIREKRTKGPTRWSAVGRNVIPGKTTAIGKRISRCSDPSDPSDNSDNATCLRRASRGSLLRFDRYDAYGVVPQRKGVTPGQGRAIARMHKAGSTRGLLPGGGRKSCGCGCDQGGLILEHFRNAGSGFFCFFPLLLFQTFPHRGNGFSGVTSVLARSVELVLVPEAPRKAVRRCQLALALNEHFVDLADGS